MLINVLLVFLSLKLCTSIDTITPTIPLIEGNTLISKSRRFSLGFFSPGNSTQRYVGLWFTQVSEQTVIWVANRNNPINGSRGTLSINEDGHLTLSSGKTIIWSPSNLSLTSPLPSNTTSCQLLDTGNLALTTNNGRTLLWQSFDHITNAYLPGMKLGLDRTAGLNRYLTSWRSKDDPRPGYFSVRMDPNGSPQLFLYQGSDPIWRSGPWIGHRWGGVPNMASDYYEDDYSFVNNENETFMILNKINTSIISIILLDYFSGRVKFQNWQDNTKRWIEVFSSPGELCDLYGECGAFGNCNPNSGTLFQCTCFPGYTPKSSRDWGLRDGSQGCMREGNKSMCRNGEGFLKISGVKLPDTSKVMVKVNLTMKDCKEDCLNNCSCVGYAIVSHDSNGGSDCVLYTQLMDTRIYSRGGQDVYLRLDATELAKYQKPEGLLANKKLKEVFIVLITALSSSVLVLLMCWVHRKKKIERDEEAETALWIRDAEESDSSSDLPLFTRNEVIAATNDFGLANKLGEGGFGSVYKGLLDNGQEIAVKKLAPNSGQGIQEFKNEVQLITKLQHRNLVKMLGCCVQGEEKMLIYEFMPNKSLDTFIFMEENKSCLDWRKRFDIIKGIARGMVYLHQDSRLKIIHRDLKASNILLDKDMVPKISDFGIARIFGNEQVQINTVRVVGTYGYMAPEYALHGLMSVKSDVFSFGVLLLEVVTGRKNSGFYPDNPSINLVGHIWELWKEGRSLEIVDPCLKDADIEELLVCIHIGLLCVQEYADDRPTMSAIVFMLSNKVELPSPNHPAFIHKGNHRDGNLSSSSAGAYSLNEHSMTATVDGR